MGGWSSIEVKRVRSSVMKKMWVKKRVSVVERGREHTPVPTPIFIIRAGFNYFLSFSVTFFKA